MKSKVAICNDMSVKSGISKVMGMIDSVRDFIEGKHVAIHPNDTWATPEDTTAVTRADAVEAVIHCVKQNDPKKITVTGGSGDGDTAEIFKLMGIDQVIKKEGVEFVDHNKPPFVEVGLDYGPQKSIMVNKNVLDYQCVISLAQHKVHKTATVTLTMKNIAMSFPAADYYGHPRETGLHPQHFFDDMHGFIVGMCKRFPITIGIIVGHPAMIGSGPIGGKTFESGLTIGSTDFVACDAIGARMLGFDRVEHVERAMEEGLGQCDLKNIQIAGVPLKEAEALFEERSGITLHGYVGAKR